MATTTLIPLHAGKGQTIAASLGRTTDYMKNPDKTDGGEWVSAYECDPLTVDSEFLFSKHQYSALTGRNQGKRDVIAYHLRQAFKPGEVDSATANRIGYELAMSLTKGKYAFICCTHVDKSHIHNHITINSVSLDCTRKFRNFYNSSFAIRRISDKLCVENGLSIVEEPKKSKGKNYGKWLGGNKPKTERDKLRDIIDENIVIGNTLTDLLAALERAGVEIKKGKQLAFRMPGAKKFFRQNTLGENYTEAAILERLAGRIKHNATITKPKLLIDIEAKLHQGYGGGFEHWARIENLKQSAKTLMFLKENGVNDYEELVVKASSTSETFSNLNQKIKDAEKRLAEISELQKQIGTYGKTREVYKQYIASGRDSDFYEKYRGDIVLHEAAKSYFDKMVYGKNKKLPSINTLKQEWAALAAEKKKLYSGYRGLRQEMIDWQTAKSNVDVVLFGGARQVGSCERDAR